MKPLAVVSSPRTSLDPSCHPRIDAFLKGLKGCSRRLLNITCVFTDEMRLLERLYYKGKNQHRSSLFWKRLVDIRRFARRLVSMNVLDSLETLRRSFFGSVTQQNQKAMKGSWSHYPDGRFIASVRGQLFSSLSLIRKMRERLLVAYHQFSLAMQNGAFIQLVLMLAAISSRMAALLPGLEATVQDSCSLCDDVLQILDPDYVSRSKSFAHPAPVTEPSSVSTDRQAVLEIDAQFILEDVGAVEPRSGTSFLPSNIARLSTIHDERSLHTITVKSEDTALHNRRAVREFMVPDNSEKIPNEVTKTAEAHVVSIHPVDSSHLKKAKKKKRDEIDEIFGF